MKINGGWGVPSAVIVFTFLYLENIKWPCRMSPTLTKREFRLHAAFRKPLQNLMLSNALAQGFSSLPRKILGSHNIIFTDTVQHLCYKNSTNDGLTWNKLTLLAARGCNPTVVCNKWTNNIILQYDVSASEVKIIHPAEANSSPCTYQYTVTAFTLAPMKELNQPG